MPCDGSAVLKGVEFILCVVCLVYKRYTDNEAIRVFYHLEKLSREWPLLNNITWDENGALLADITFGAFAIITLGLLIAQLTGELRRVRRLVCFYLVLGCIMFLVVGGLCLAALDQVPHHLVDNAIVLGVLSILTGLLFLVDLATTGNKKLTTATATEKKKPAKIVSSPKPVPAQDTKEKKDSSKEVDEKKTKNTSNGVLKELRSSFKKKKTVEDLDGRGVVVEKNEREKNVEFETEHDPKIEDNRLEQSGDEYRQYGRRRMDNRGFTRSTSDDSGRFSSEQRFRNDFMDAERDRWLDRQADRADARHVTVTDGGGGYEARRERPASMLEVELDEHYLRPQDYYIEKRVKEREERDYYVEKRLSKDERDRRVQDQRVTSSSARHDMSDEEYQQQLPSVSFMLSERGRKVLPSLKSSPVERLAEVTSSAAAKPRYYFNSSRDPASGSSAPPSPHSPAAQDSLSPRTMMTQDSLNPRTMTQDSLSPRSPGYVLHTASAWDDPDRQPPGNVTDRIQHWFRNRQTGKNP